MAEINFNNNLRSNVRNKLNQQFYDSYFEDNYDPTKPMNQQSNSLTMKSLNDGSTTPDFAAMQSAYNDAQNSKTKNSFFSMSADAAMPDQTYGLQDSMMGMSINPDGSLNYNNTQPQNLGFRSMVDMANDANNFDSQFVSPDRFNSMGQMGPVKSNMNAPTIDRSNVMGRDLEADDGAQIVDGLTSPYTVRGQIANDLRDIAAIPGRIKDGVMGSAPVEFIGEQFNKAKDGIMGSSAMDFFRGLPTPGNLLMNMAATRNPLNPRASNYNPTLQGQVDFMKDQGMYGTNPNTGLGQITGGRLAGKHLVSFAGSNDLGKMYGKDLSKLQGYLATMPQRFSRLMANNPAGYKKKIDNLNAKIAQNKREAQQAQLAREASTANRARAANASVYANADAGGFTRGGGGFASHNTGTNSNFSNNTGRGRTGYQEGGLASMFTRRR